MSNSAQFAAYPIAVHGYRRLLRRIPWVVAAAALGGLLGLLAARMASPEYRSTAVLNIGVDYGRSQWLDEDADRLVMDRVQGLILSDEVLAVVLDRINSLTLQVNESAPRTAGALRDSLRMVWVDNRWELSATSRDPAQAADIANAWAEVSLEQLHLASEHAWQVAELQSLYFRVFCRPEIVQQESGESFWVCDEGVPGTAPAGLPGDLLDAIEDSRGIIPALSFGWEARATPPAEPETGQRSVLILGGMLVGLLVGTLAVVTIKESQA